MKDVAIHLDVYVRYCQVLRAFEADGRAMGMASCHDTVYLEYNVAYTDPG